MSAIGAIANTELIEGRAREKGLRMKALGHRGLGYANLAVSAVAEVPIIVISTAMGIPPRKQRGE